MQGIPEAVQAVVAKIDEGRFYSPRQYAELLGVTPAAIHRARWRHPTSGPAWVKIGGGLRASGASIIKSIVESAATSRPQKKQPRNGGAFTRAEAA